MNFDFYRLVKSVHFPFKPYQNYANLLPPHPHQSLNREGRWGTTDEFATSIVLWSSAVSVHDSQAHRKMDVTREHIRRVLEPTEILLSIQTGFSLVNAAVVCTAGVNNIRAELVQAGGEDVIIALTTICNKIGRQENG